MTKLQDSYPEIGMRRGNWILACHGDDYPQEFAQWLDPLVNDFDNLLSTASEYAIPLIASGDPSPLSSVVEFCERIGIHFERNSWEGSLISGTYYIGWIRAGTVRAAKAAGKKLVHSLEAILLEEMRVLVLQEVNDVRELDELTTRTSWHGENIRRQLAELRSELNRTQSELKDLRARQFAAEAIDTYTLDHACIQLAAAIISGDHRQLVAGPIALWDDGVVYAICTCGGVAIPENSSPFTLLRAIERSGRRLIRVHEKTIIGGWISGPIYRKGSANIKDWHDVWERRETRPRTFFTDPPEYSDRVRSIHETLAERAQENTQR